MRKILIADRDSTTLNDIARLVTALYYEPIAAYNAASITNIVREEVAAVFIEIETKSINVGEVINYFNNPRRVNEGQITPIFLMTSKQDSFFLDQAKRFPYSDILIKPFKVETVFEKFEYEQFTNHYRLEQMGKYGTSMGEWLEKFGGLLDK